MLRRRSIFEYYFQTPEVVRLEKIVRACGRGVMPIGRKHKIVFGERPSAEDRLRILNGLLENVGMEGLSD